MKPILILSMLLVPTFAMAQTSGTITDLGGGMSIYSDTQGNSGMIQDLGGGYSTFSGTGGHGSAQDLGGGLSIFSFTPRQNQTMQPIQPLPHQPLQSGSAPAALLNQMFMNSQQQLNRR